MGTKSTGKLIASIQKALSRDLLKPDQRARLKADSHPTTGHCYVAAEALYHLWGRERGFLPCHLRTSDNVHWFLRHRDGRVLDPTAEQFPQPVDYSKGTNSGFLTGNLPSKRCRLLLSRINL